MELYKRYKNPDDRTTLVEIARIISNDNPQVVSDFTELSNDYHTFYNKHKKWFDAIVGKDGEYSILIATAYWLAGYNTPFEYGAYIDWCEETDEIILQLETAISMLGYPLSFDGLELTDDESTSEVLDMINKHFQESGYNLFYLSTYSDSYHLFIAQTEKFGELIRLGGLIGFDFDCDFE